MKTKRDITEEILLKEFGIVRPFTLEDSQIVEKYKDGTFGMSTLSFLLYSNGHNLRGKSSGYPHGLIYENGETLFSIGYFRKELDSVEEDGYLFIVAPRGEKATEKVKDFSEKILKNKSIPCKGIYVRFLKLEQYVRLLNEGFLPAKEHPWHPEAPEEDESYCNAILNLDDILAFEEGSFRVKNLVGTESRNFRRKAARAYKTFRNFLDENKAEFKLLPYTAEKKKIAEEIIKKHFEFLKQEHKDAGSTSEDYSNLIKPEWIGKENILSCIGYLNELPVSIFVGEDLNNGIFGLYACLTLRNSEKFKDKFDLEGFTAIPQYAYLELFKELKIKDYDKVHFGPSETPDLNKFKRQFGCKNEPSYWAMLLK